MKKRSQLLVLKFLIALVLGLVIYGTTATIIAGFFRLSDAGLNSFYNLAENINKLDEKTRGELEVFSVIMDDDTIIASFNKGVDPLIAKNIWVYYSPAHHLGIAKYFGVFLPSTTVNIKGVGVPIGMLGTLSQGNLLPSTLYIKRPTVSACKNKSCICLIREFDFDRGYIDILDIELEYENVACVPTDVNLLYSNKGPSTPIIYRSKLHSGLEQPRQRAVYLEKGGSNLYGFCEESPCLTESTGDVQVETQGLPIKDFIKELISKSYTLKGIKRLDLDLVKESKACLDVSPQTNPIQMMFKENNNGAIDFRWDSEKNKAVARDRKKDLHYDSAEVSKKRKGGNEVFSEIDADWEYEKAIIPILDTKSFEAFYKKIAELINWNDPCWRDCLFLVDGSQHLDATTDYFVKNKITKNRPDYIKSWVNPGNCKQSKANYDCNLFGNKGKCELQANGNVCMENKEQKCGSTCLCPSDYLSGDIFKFSIGDQEWEFEIKEKEIVQRCVYNCPK